MKGTPTTTPQNLVVVANNGSITLNWNSVAEQILEYQVVYPGGKISDDKWLPYTNSTNITIDQESTSINPSIIYARYNDKVNVSQAATYTETKIDTTPPTVSYSLAGGTYNENKTVRVTVSDTNFKSMSVYVFKNKAISIYK